MEKMKVSFISTVFNEEVNIVKLLDSLCVQSRMPDEIIIVDGGSTDATTSVISNFKFQISNKQKKPIIKLIIKKGNRSVGRNEAIKNSTGDIIVCSDAGCVLDKSWIDEIIKPFKNSDVGVVAGYYQGLSRSIFQRCLVPYVLVMQDKIDADNFLPASRSMAFRKSVWEKAGKFPEKFSHNEDYVFSRNLRNQNFLIVFCKQAIVYWIPRNNFGEAFYMFLRFALGDIEAKIFRPKVGVIFLRYILGILLLYFAIIRDSISLSIGLALLVIFYIIWAIGKNYKHVRDFRALFILPLLQIISDLAVIMGTTLGFIKLWDIKNKR